MTLIDKKKNQIYGLKHNELVHISDVESGLNCRCVCPYCGEQLIAKKGSKMIHHFAHYSNDYCGYGIETSLHIAAKEMISKAKKFTIPEVIISFPNSSKKPIKYSNSMEIEIDTVKLEYKHGNIIPDLVIYSGGKSFYVEIYVTHPINETKLKKIKMDKVSVIEINLSKTDFSISEKELSNIIIGDSKEKKWKYNVVAEKMYNRFITASEKKKVIRRGLALHVDYCPIKARVWKGKPYANYLDDCSYCDYRIYSDDNNKYMYCAGTNKVKSLEDLKLYEMKDGILN